MLVSSDSMLCLVTWIRVKDFFTFFRLILAFFSMRRKARTIPGLFKSWILIRSQKTLVLISLWQNSAAFAQFNTIVPEHAGIVTALYRTEAETWSGAFTLDTKSATSEPWKSAASFMTTN